MEANIPKLKKGNCLIFSILFWIKNPKARIMVRWNKNRNVPSFIPVLNETKYVYKTESWNKRTKLIFEGKVFTVK